MRHLGKSTKILAIVGVGVFCIVATSYSISKAKENKKWNDLFLNLESINDSLNGVLKKQHETHEAYHPFESDTQNMPRMNENIAECYSNQKKFSSAVTELGGRAESFDSNVKTLIDQIQKNDREMSSNLLNYCDNVAYFAAKIRENGSYANMPNSLEGNIYAERLKSGSEWIRTEDENYALGNKIIEKYSKDKDLIERLRAIK